MDASQLSQTPDDGSDLACANGGHVWMDVGARGVTVEQECQFCPARRCVLVDAVDSTPEPEFEGERDDRGGDLEALR